jgi:ribosomal protein L11 methyltransferase
VPAEHAEDVGAWLVEGGAGGVALEPRADRVDVVVYGEERGPLEALARAVRTELHALGARATVRTAPPETAGWETSWIEHLEPVELTPDLVVVPTTVLEPRVREGARVVRLEPAMAFGFGDHPTTHLAARAVAAACAAGARTVLDVGTGTGVLAIVAALSGASDVLGVDIDPEAVRAAKRNAALNGVRARCRFERGGIERVRRRFSLVVANIDVGTLEQQAERLARAVAPGGRLVLTGALEEHRRALSKRYAALGLRPIRARTRAGRRAMPDERGWLLLELARPAPAR